MKYIASVSWGKDSTAMLIKIIENELPLDEVIFYDTGVEFWPIYKTCDLFNEVYLKPRGIKYTELRTDKPFMWYMLEKDVGGKHPHKGYGWCGGVCRWGTTLKIKTMNDYLKRYEGEELRTYIGIAFDEPERFKRLGADKIAPLVDMKITEEEALRICYAHGFNFDGLYKSLKRLSCWCCRNKNLKELNVYRIFFPEYFKALCDLERQIGKPMKGNKYLKERKWKYE